MTNCWSSTKLGLPKKRNRCERACCFAWRKQDLLPDLLEGMPDLLRLAQPDLSSSISNASYNSQHTNKVKNFPRCLEALDEHCWCDSQKSDLQRLGRRSI